MLRESGILTGAVIAALLGTGAAHAEVVPTSEGLTEPPAFDETVNSSNTRVEALLPPFARKFSVSYWGQFVGPSVGFLADGRGGANLPKQDGTLDEKGRPVLSSAATFGYKVAPGYSLGAQLNFDSYPIAGADMVLRDPNVKLSKKKIIDYRNLTMDGVLSFYLPVTKDSQSVNMFTKVRTTQNFNYDLPGGSRWSAGLLSYQYFSINGHSDNQVQDVIAYAGPNLSYKITPKLAATFWYEMAAHHNRGAGMGHWENEGTDLQTGLSWDITPNFNVNPYIQTYPISNVTLNSTTIGAYITGTLL